MAGGEWLPAGVLLPGDEVLKADGSFDVVQAVALAQRPQLMYNLTVAQAHTFFVGDGQWLVHNRCSSLISDDPRLVKEAQKAAKSHQDSLDHLVEQLNQGNMNPGGGTKWVFGDVFEARTRDGARVYFRNAADGSVEILAKSTKRNQDRVIRILKELYE